MLGWIIGGAAIVAVVAFLPWLIVSWLNDLGTEPMRLRTQAAVFAILVGLEIGAGVLVLVI